ncbi:MAG: hydantoinase B/oxoprolinase family protein, partial [Actinomycetota bacterium]
KEAIAPQSVYTYVLGMKYPSIGINGGHNGSPNELWLKAGGPNAYHCEHTALYVPLEAGERIEYKFAGGAGWGDPLERDPEKVRDDVLDEYVSRESAERDYGVIFTGNVDDYSLEVDIPKTYARRKEMRSGVTAGA